MTERSDVELMLSFQEGDQEAFSVLVDRHRNAIVNLTYRYLGNRSDAEDLAQEVFLRVYRARARYRPEAKFTTWLYRVAVNACLNEVRDRKHRPTFGAASLAGGDDEGFAPSVADERTESPVQAAQRSELRERVRAAVDELPDRQRLALLMNKFHGFSYEELAATMDLTIPAIKSLLVRARENVRRLIEPHLSPGVDPIPERKRGTA
jgi:RNA polymerase sigma-70 factor (ECF subfamily)